MAKNSPQEDRSLGAGLYPAVMMVVPFYPYPVVGGLERQAHELAKALSQKGISVQAISGKFNRTDPSEEVVEGIAVQRIPLSKIKWLRFIQSPFFLLWALFSSRRTYDVVHLHQFSWFGLFSILIAKLLGKAVITKLPNVGHHGVPGVVASRFGGLKLSILLSSEAIVAMSRESISELSAVNFPLERVLMTPNGIRIPSNSNKARAKDVSEKCKVVFVGRLMPQKGLEDLLYAWQKLVSKGSGAELEIWGDGPIKEKLVALNTRLGISESVKFRGHVTNVAEQLKSMDIFVLPSYAEGNSNAILEAMVAGLPIVASHVGGTAMQVGEVGSATLFEAGDRVGLTTCLEMLVKNPQLREEIGRKMRSRVEASFDIHGVANTYIRAYKLLANGEMDRMSEVSNPVVMEG